MKENVKQRLHTLKSSPIYFQNPRLALLALIPKGALTILDVGCGIGALGKAFKEEDSRRVVVGVEIVPEIAEIAARCLDKVIVGDIEQIIDDPTGPLGGTKFDVVIFGDVLEHLVDPWNVLKATSRVLNDNGCVVASIPNVRHISVIYNLLVRGDWKYVDAGFLDKGHLRFFTSKTVKSLFGEAGFCIEVLLPKIDNSRRYRLGSLLLSLVLMDPKARQEFVTAQYLVRARKTTS